MEIKEIIAVLQAFENGEEIEEYVGNDYWRTISNNQFRDFRFANIKYRIKPKQEYFPFYYNDDLVGKTVKSNKSDKFVNHPKLLIIRQDSVGVIIGSYQTYMSYEELFNYYIFLDGSKCGKLT